MEGSYVYPHSFTLLIWQKHENVLILCLLLSENRMNLRISTKNSSYENLPCLMVHFVMKVPKCLDLCPLSTIPWEWRGPKRGGERIVPWVCGILELMCSQQLIVVWEFPTTKVLLCKSALQMPSGHWHHYAPVLTCFYIIMRCVRFYLKEVWRELNVVMDHMGPWVCICFSFLAV